ncbi:MAG: hypothetical protein WCP36_01260 [Methanomicrobiales archaeon]
MVNRMERLELVVLLISVVIAVILGDYLYSVTHNVLVNVVTILVATPFLYYGVKWIARAAGYPLREY